jgi:hypothetical protein
MKSKSIVDEYFEYFTKYKNEYGDKICLLMQIGSFYEIKMIKNEHEEIGNLNVISSLLKQIKTLTKLIETIPI